MDFENVFDLNRHGGRFLPEYGKQHLSDHLPMAVWAMKQLGADEARIEQFTRKYLSRLDPVPSESVQPLLPGEETPLGTRRLYASFRAGLLKFIQTEGLRQTISTQLTLLKTGMLSGAFHAIIRLAYGVEVNAPGEIASALAYLADAYQPLDLELLESDRADADLQGLLSHIADQAGRGEVRITGLQGVIFEKVDRVLAHEQYRKLLLSCRFPKGQTLSDIAAAALCIFMSTLDFTALHGVTASHALRILLPFSREPQALLDIFWLSICVAYLTMGTPRMIPLNRLETNRGEHVDLESLKRSAISSNDEHDIKFTYTCLEEYACYGRETYLLAALARLKGNVSLTFST